MFRHKYHTHLARFCRSWFEVGFVSVGQWGRDSGRELYFHLAMGVVWCLLCMWNLCWFWCCTCCQAIHLILWFKILQSVTPQINLQCNVSRKKKKKKKTQSIKKSTKVTLKFSVNMSSPTLMFGNFFGTWGWWGTISRLTCPATGLLVRGHPAHASTGSSAQLRVEIWYTTCQRNRKMGSGMH